VEVRGGRFIQGRKNSDVGKTLQLKRLSEQIMHLMGSRLSRVGENGGSKRVSGGVSILRGAGDGRLEKKRECAELEGKEGRIARLMFRAERGGLSGDSAQGKGRGKRSSIVLGLTNEKKNEDDEVQKETHPHTSRRGGKKRLEKSREFGRGRVRNGQGGGEP